MSRPPAAPWLTEWVTVGTSFAPDGTLFRTYARTVHDGRLVAVIADEPDTGWHMTIAHRNRAGDVVRYPTQSEVGHAHAVCWPPEVHGLALDPERDDVDPDDPQIHIYQQDHRQELP